MTGCRVWRRPLLGLLAGSAFALVALGIVIGAQTRSDVTFEVASIKRSVDGGPAARSVIGEVAPGGVWRATSATVFGLIRTLYPGHLLPEQIQNLPPWAGTEFYDIDARAGAAASPEQMQAMAQALLADRFKLTMHMEQRELPASLLVLSRRDGRPGPGMRTPAIDCEAYRAAQARGGPLPTDPTRRPFGDRQPCVSTIMAVVDQTRLIPGAQLRLTAGGATVAGIIPLLSRELARPIVDRSGLTAVYDIELQYSVGAPPASGDAGPPLESALSDQLGLKLQSGRAAMDVLVVDHVERPSGN
jgi:uncharacterized protein (TIGR03435 family)